MKRKDDLLRLAFGELSDDAARALEARADDAERAEVAAFRQLHDDLRHLPPPPPDNLTAERLRAAILDRDLKTRRPFAWGPFLLAPAALAAFAAVIVLPRLRPRPEPQIVAMDASRLVARAPLESNLADQLREHPLSSLSHAQVAPVITSPVSAPGEREEPAPRSHRHRGRRNAPVAPIEEPEMNTEGLQAQVVQRNAMEDEPGSVASSAPPQAPATPTIAAPASTLVEASPGATGKTETVVIVSSKRDLETGAPAATEKEVAGVLVGG